MKGFFRNPEIRLMLIRTNILCVIFCAAAFFWNVGFGVFTFSLCVLLESAFLLTTYERYKRISRLSSEIDRLLHDDAGFDFSDFGEGELAILQSELQKMLTRLREQKQCLIDERTGLSDSIANISHQIRTPLTSINLLAMFLSDPDISDERREKLSRELFDLISKIDWLVGALLKLSRIDAGTVVFKRESIPLKALLDKAAEPVLVTFELRAQTLSVEASGEFTGDIGWTCEAICNILKNCSEHTPESGKITVFGETTPIFTRIIISDNGTGISPDDLPHIFERFYKGKNSTEKSVGIGLALSKNIIKAQNGTVKAENLPTGGASFTLKFYKGSV